MTQTFYLCKIHKFILNHTRQKCHTAFLKDEVEVCLSKEALTQEHLRELCVRLNNQYDRKSEIIHQANVEDAKAS